MAITAMMMIVAAGISAQHANAVQGATRKVPVCMEGAVIFGASEAQQRATQMFSTAGVRLEWHTGLEHGACPAGAIQISLTSHTESNLRAGVLAYALPYEGTHIRIFYDRIRHFMPGPEVSILLAHVLAHEITYLLQGVGRHSKTG